jgi:hypothetical protein
VSLSSDISPSWLFRLHNKVYNCTCMLIPPFHLNASLQYFRHKTAEHSGRAVRHELFSFARTLRSLVRIPLRAWIFVCVYSVFVLSCVGSAALRRAVPHSRSSTDCLRIRNGSETKRFTDALCPRREQQIR